jgi:beta-lactamase superfamily II metal-dependent hydrolase
MPANSNPTHFIQADLARVFATNSKEQDLLVTLAWGDKVEVINTGDKFVEIRIDAPREQEDGSVRMEPTTGFIRSSPSRVIAPIEENRVLKIDFVDVQQGDGAVVETPNGKVMLIDGGDNQLFARYLAARYPGSSAESPCQIDCILVTHGDADHFMGLTEIHESEKNANPSKRLFIHPHRVFHNGIVKRPSKIGAVDRPQKDLLGPTVEVDGQLFLSGLESDLLKVDTAEMNQPFKAWRRALEVFDSRGKIEFRRLERGSDIEFNFLSRNEPAPISVEVLGPITSRHGGNDTLKFLGTPSNKPRQDEDGLNLNLEETGALSASHTINGHSVVLRLGYGDFHFLFAGDLNAEAEAQLAADHEEGSISLQSDILKVPHHGSADFKAAFLAAVAPAVSVVSSGDESLRKEFIHPRANLIGALGRFSSINEPLIFVTEMVAFFEMIGFVSPKEADAPGSEDKPPKSFFAFRRAAFGIVKVRTDGSRILVYTNSGMKKLKEAYAFARRADKRLKAVAVIQV